MGDLQSIGPVWAIARASCHFLAPALTAGAAGHSLVDLFRFGANRLPRQSVSHPPGKMPMVVRMALATICAYEARASFWWVGVLPVRVVASVALRPRHRQYLASTFLRAHVIAQQFTLDLLQPPAPTLENFVPGANAALLAALRDLLSGRGPQFVHIWGPTGSGRTHLLAAVAGQARQCARSAVPGVPRFAPEQTLYVVDDVHQLDSTAQAALFALQNQIREHPTTHLVTAADLPPAQLNLREDVRTRLAWGLVFALQPIAESDQATALLAYAQARGARVDEDLVPYMLTRLPRDMRTLVAVLDALDAFALARRRALTVPLLRDWLQQGAPQAGQGSDIRSR
ncbi:MAG TPA: DnaA regulatory inactivator Hda [Burkholderiaceae bacterium]|nr:DnaA regulatory inactivator Hda [Burkholderiaceae bacterium]